MAKDSAKDKKKADKKKGKKAKDELQVKLAAKEVARRQAKAKAKAEDVKAALEAARLPEPADYAAALRVGEGYSLADVDPASTPAFTGDKVAAEAALAELADQVAELQERLYAESKAGGKRSLLLVIQGMDTSGKGGIMRHVVGAADPQGVRLTSFKAPTAQERANPFLWRIRNALPTPGTIGVFDRSHYEDVLVVRVHDLVPRQQWARRYAQINAFEKSTVAAGTTVVKVMLHISAQEQKERLAARLETVDKQWKFNPGDIDERAHWDEYMEAYQVALEKCSTPEAPWYVVPADKKWYARLAVMNLLLGALQQMDPQWPAVDYDIEEQKARLAES